MWGLAVAVVVAAAVAVSPHCWRRGANALSLAPISAASVFGGLVVYGIIAPAENELHSHRARRKARAARRPPELARSCSSTKSTKDSGST